MRRAPALNTDGIPRQHFVEQAHSALMGNVIFDPLPV
jgi:hypothetical protein